MKTAPINYQTSTLKAALILSISLLTSCNDILDVPLDKSLITEEKTFSNDVTATSAVTAMYNTMVNFSAFSGKPDGIAALASLSAGELINYPESTNLVEFEIHQILETNSIIESTWNNIYNIIYQSNAIIEGIQNSQTLSVTKASQLEGEARFVRAFCYFHLVNIFNDIPLVTTTDYNINKTLSKSPSEKIYTQIISDLIAAQTLLPEQYIGSYRVRPNKKTASALLARIYLYRKDYVNAELMASSIIEDNSYTLTPEIENIFLKESTETIWQLMNINPSYSTIEGFFFNLDSSPTDNILAEDFVETFDPNDKRTTNWIGEFYDEALQTTFYYPHKYKVKVKIPEEEATEYSIVFRLAELYLIRAEARARQNNIQGAEEDVNEIRKRAGLDEIHGSDLTTILETIAQERKTELFTEWGHLWLDLKRTDMATQTIGNGITTNDLYYPIPKNEFNRNPNLGKQNDGY